MPPCQVNWLRHIAGVWQTARSVAAPALLSLLLLGCSGEPVAAPQPSASSAVAGPSPTAAPALTSTPPPSPTAAPTPTATPPPSPTAPPPTATPAPSPTASPSPTVLAQPLRFGYPIGLAGRAPGDGFFIRHGYASENTWYNPGHWHTGEDWYALAGDTAGAEVYAVAAGEVVYVGSNYPGRVVIVAHDGGLFSMYGHLDPAVAVGEGDVVERGQLLGTVLRRGDAVPNHLHFEIRTFLFTDAVNGSTPRYGFRCGPGCAPGPGYWPITAPDHPSDLGWRNPTHVIAGRMFGEPGGLGEVVVPERPPRTSLTLWSAPPGEPQEALDELPLAPGERLRLLEVRAGPEDSRETSAQGYLLWYRVATLDGAEGWVEAAVASPFEMGSDGRPSSVELVLLPSP